MQLVPYQKPGLLTRIANSIKNVMRFPGSGNSWNYWGRNYGINSPTLDYGRELGDLTLHSLPMAAVRWLGNTLPEAPLQVKKSSGEKGGSEPIDPHPFLSVMRRPNPFYAGSRLWKGFALSWILSGNVYLLKVRNAGGQVIQLFYLPHWMVRPRWPENESSTPTFISHYEYIVNGVEFRYKPEDIVHFRDGEDPRNPRLGLSPLNAILRELYNDSELTSYGASLAGGSGVPPYFLGIDPDINMTEEMMNALSEQAYRKTTGDNRGRPLVISGAKAYKLSFSPREMQFDESHDFPEARFCAVIGIPAVVLELAVGMKHSIYNNVKQAQERAYDSYLKPLQNYIADELTHQLLLPDFEDNKENIYVAHDYSKVQALQEDENEKAKRLGGLYKDGLIMRSEGRSGMGYGPSAEGMKGLTQEEIDEADKVFAVMSTTTLTPPIPDEEEEPAPTGDEFPTTIPVNGNGNRLEKVKSVPPADKVEEYADWWRQRAPDDLKDLIDAEVNGGNRE